MKDLGNLSYFLGQSQFMKSSIDVHWNALKRLLCYLLGTLRHGLILRRKCPLHLYAFSDVDWAGIRITTTVLYIVYLGSNHIAWSSKRQTTPARSSTEAEFHVVAATST